MDKVKRKKSDFEIQDHCQSPRELNQVFICY
jgi:hypothetical protein